MKGVLQNTVCKIIVVFVVVDQDLYVDVGWRVGDELPNRII